MEYKHSSKHYVDSTCHSSKDKASKLFMISKLEEASWSVSVAHGDEGPVLTLLLGMATGTSS